MGQVRKAEVVNAKRRVLSLRKGVHEFAALKRKRADIKRQVFSPRLVTRSLDTYTHTYIHTCVHTYTHTYIHAYTYTELWQYQSLVAKEGDKSKLEKTAERLRSDPVGLRREELEAGRVKVIGGGRWVRDTYV